MLLFIIVVIAAIAFEYINGFHDAANAIATVVSTKVLTPRQAIALGSVFQSHRCSDGNGRGVDDRERDCRHQRSSP